MWFNSFMMLRWYVVIICKICHTKGASLISILKDHYFLIHPSENTGLKCTVTCIFLLFILQVQEWPYQLKLGGDFGRLSQNLMMGTDWMHLNKLKFRLWQMILVNFVSWKVFETVKIKLEEMFGNRSLVLVPEELML